MQTTKRLGIAVLSLAVTAAGCGGSESNFGGDRYSPGGASDMSAGARQCFGSNDCSPGYQCNAFGVCVPLDNGGGAQESPDLGPPPEVHVKVDPPASGKRFVYVALPAEDTVVKIDSTTLGVKTITVGHDPGPLRTVPGHDVAVVLNKRSNTITVVRGNDDGSDTLLTLPTASGLNQLTLSPNGNYALAWFDLTASGGVLAPKQTLQEVTLVWLEAGKEQAVKLAVGFRPSDVQWAPDGSAVWMVTEQGVSIISLAQLPKPGIVPTVSLVHDPLKDTPPTIVRVTSDGKRALALPPGEKKLRAVELATGALTDVDLADDPTDIDLTPSGDLAVVVLRSAQEIDVVHLPADLADPTGIAKVSIGDYVAGQAELTADGAHALLFTNAVSQKVMLVADLNVSPPKVRALPLQKAVRNVLVAPDGKSAVVVHNKVPGTPSASDTLEQYLDKLQAYSLFDVAGGYAKLQPTDAAPGPVAFTTDGASAYLLLRDDAASVRSVEALDLKTFLVTSVPLGSPPVAVGVVPSTSQVFVAQDHALGRMTFLDTGTWKTRTLTGFGLNGGIIE